MQTISDDDKKIWMDDGCDKEWTINIYQGEDTTPKYTFHNDDIQDDSLEIEAQLFEGQYIIFGGCYARSLKLNLPRFRATSDSESAESTSSDFEELDYKKKDRITVEATASVDGGPSTEPLYLFWGYIDSVTSESNSLVKKVQAYDILAYIQNYDVRTMWNSLLKLTVPRQLKFSTILDKIFKLLNDSLIADGYSGIPDDDDNAANLKPLRRKTDLFKTAFPGDICWVGSDNKGMRRNGLQKKDAGSISGLEVVRWFCNIIGSFGYIDPQDGKFDILSLPDEPSSNTVPDYYKTAEYYNTSISTYTGVAFGLDGYLKEEEDTTAGSETDESQAESQVDNVTNISKSDHIYAYGYINSPDKLEHEYTHADPDLGGKISNFYGIDNNLTHALLGSQDIVEPLQEQLYKNIIKLKSYNPATVEFGNCLAVQLCTSLNLIYTQQYPEGNTKDIDFTYLVSHITYSGFNNTVTNLKNDIENESSVGSSDFTNSLGGGDSGGGTRFGRYRDRNGGPLTVSSDLKTILTITFVTTSTSADVTEWCEIFFTLTKTDESKTSDVKLTYTLDGTTLDYQPAERYTESGRHTISFQYDIGSITSVGRHTWIVQMNCSNATLTIDKGCASGVIEGIGLDATKIWDGNIIAKDTISPFKPDSILNGIKDQGILKLHKPLRPSTMKDSFGVASPLDLITANEGFSNFTDDLFVGSLVFDPVTEKIWSGIDNQASLDNNHYTNGTIILPSISSVRRAHLTSTTTRPNIKLQCSFDGGETWYGWNNEIVDWKENIEMSVDQFNRLALDAWSGRHFKLKVIIPEKEYVTSIEFYGGILDA